MATPHALHSRQMLHLLAVYWGYKVLCYLGAVVLAAVGLALAGASMMLWDITPAASQWVLLAVPCIGLLAAAACWFAARAATDNPALDQCLEYLEAHQLMLYAGSTEG
jgi:hypothetical protein